MAEKTKPFWLDWDYDRRNADTGTKSRYGNYLYQHDKSFRDIWTDDPSVEFARIAWRVATGPIMSPPLVRSHPRIMDVSLTRSDWNGEMTADVRLVSHRPQPLGNAKTADGAYYRDYRLNAWDEYEGIGEDDLTRSSYLLTEVRLLWQLPAGKLPTITEVPTGSDAIFRQAVECLDVLVWALNREVAPVIEQLEAS
ncbi:hypothetical protein ABZ671_18715 [Micromonospora sp. NPDC006766]|uniref:hypothetical protein n=1 Tax=Micromonospora sp. NPDC006766 TaxID=3154778 RepID=UPI00340FA656